MLTWFFRLFRRRPAPAQPAPPPVQRPLPARAPQRSRGRLTGAQLRDYQQLRHTARDRAAAAPPAPAPAPADPGAAALDPYLLLIASYAGSVSEPERPDSAPAESWSGGGGESGGAGASGSWDAPVSDTSDSSCSASSSDSTTSSD